ncbi:Double-strand break repair protein MRE11A [Daphnia magna]|uniref:Double-strand break repair protein n=1 Tax=Daphnia magna TaxID=35525 RepID=A0A0N8CUT7_9CRUS|nr:Double-strand break repair protein MRE11A [Daphnia magna]
MDDTSLVGDVEEESTFNILIATDIHLGFMEKHPTRGDDSFITFEEILNYGKTMKADFVLLGGDLFHENKPSRRTLQRCMDLLRKYCLGPEEHTLQFLSDPDINFKDCSTPGVNFEDPNLRIALPVFSIHGNHDDPCGEGNYSVMDMLAATGFVNYFGKVPNLEELKFQPILLKKGDTFVSIYGIGSMNDDRLFRLFQEEKVFFEVPAELEDEWFNILVLHQNRARHGCKSYAGEHFLPHFMHLVLWGHEHECRIEPEDSLDEFRITQPGSSVATSLSPGEAVPKHVGMLKVHKKDFCIEKLPLRTTRPFVFDTLSLDEFSDIGYQFANDEVVEKIRAKINDMLDFAKTLLSDHPNQPVLPLLRLRIEHESDQQFLNTRDLHVELSLEKLVANPEDVVKLVRKRSVQEKMNADVDEEAWDTVFNMESINMVEGHLENLLIDYFKESKKPLLVMHERSLAEAVRYYVDKTHDDAFRDLIDLQAQKTKEQLKNNTAGTDRASFRDVFAEIREQRNADTQQIIDEAHSWLSGEVPAVKREPSSASDFTHRQADDDEMNVSNTLADVSPVQTRGRGRGRGRARAAMSTSTRGRGRGRGATKETKIDKEDVTIISDSEEEFIPVAAVATPRQTARSSRGIRGARATAAANPPAASSQITQAFARQSQISTQPTQRAAPPTATGTPATTARSARPKASTARGVCYVSDSD